MPKLDILTIQGVKSGKIDLPKEIFAAKINPELMAQAVRVYLANQRRAKAKVKDRSEVAGSRRKIWRQKGTGRARHGDRYAPIFVGGGVAHGPTGKENYQLKMSKKMKKGALFSALTSKLKDKEILVVKGLGKIEPKTKKAVDALQKIARNEKWEVGRGKLTIVLPGMIENVMRSGRNIPNLRLIQASQLNIYEVLNGGRLIFMEESVDVVKNTFLGKTNGKRATLKPQPSQTRRGKQKEQKR